MIANRVITPVSGQSYSDVFGQCGACPEPFAWSLGEPIATTAPPMQTVTEATGMAHPLSPGPVFDGVGGPYPTNAWWLSAATGDASRPINTLPNQVRVTDSELWLGPTGSFSVSSDRVDSLYQDQLSLGAEETLASRQVVDFDLLSVTIEWEGAIAGTMSAPLVRGSPYSTMFYDGLTPVLRAGSAISTFSGDNGRFEVTLSDGSAFIVYTAPAIPLTQDGDTLSANAPFTGSVRIARQGTSDSVLDAHRNAIPVGATVSATIDESTAQVIFDWETAGTGPLLMMSLPHHRDTLVAPSLTALSDTTLRGSMVGVTGLRWTMEWELPELGFQAPRPIASTYRSNVETALAAEKGVRPTTPGDTYFFGTQVGRMARLLLIAEALGDETTAEELEVALKAELAPWIAGTNPDPLVYDATWGGIVTEAAPFDTLAQFGSGYYNDHHFHFSYHVYAAATVARRDPQWAQDNADFYRALIRDFVNPSDADPYFPAFRNFDWFVGHSWASGILQRDF
ncbi:MAG: glycosyl hydrolase, partial [Myxococcota bacterium]